MVKIEKGYKQTEVGVIPEDWEVVELGELCTIFGRIGFRGYTKDDIVSEAEGVISLSPSNIENGTINYTDVTYITWEKYYESPEIKIHNDDIILVKTGSTYGKTAIVKKLPKEATLNPQLVVLKRLKCPSYYLGYLVQYELVQRQIRGTIVGGAIPTLSQKEVASFKIPLPPTKVEQELIAGALSDVDSLLENLDKLIEKKRNIKHGAMQVLLTGKVRLNGCGAGKGYKQTELGVIPEDWDVVEFGKIAKIKNERRNPKTSGCDDWCVELEHIDSASGLLNGSTCTTVNSSIKNVFDENDILFGKLRSYLRKYWFANREGLCSTEIWVIQPQDDKTCPKFLYFIVQTESFIAAASEAYGTHMPRADWNVIKELPIPLPPTKAEQELIAGALSDMDSEIESLERKRAKYKQIKQGMMQELLTGKTRLK